MVRFVLVNCIVFIVNKNMSEIESSENESSDIEEYVSMVYNKFTEDNIAAEAESSENTVLSPSTSVPFSSECDNKISNEAGDISRFVSSWFNVFCMDCLFSFICTVCVHNRKFGQKLFLLAYIVASSIQHILDNLLSG